MNATSKLIPLANVVRYLRSRGWQASPHPNTHILYFESPRDGSDDYSSVVLPAAENLVDYNRRITDAISAIADAEKTSPSRVTESLSLWDRDIFSARIFERLAHLRSLPLTLASEIIDELKSFLGFAAYSQFEPKKFISRTGKVGSEFVEHCRFGHTFEGSFGLRIECPLSHIEQLSFDAALASPPFERLVMERVARGYISLTTSVAKDDPSLLLENYQTGFNANMFESLARIYERLDTLSVDYSLDWSPELAPAPDARLDTALRFDGKAYELARYAAKELLKEDSVGETTIINYVTSLESEQPLTEGQDTFEHVITINWEKAAGMFVKISVPLPTPEYRRACDAHKNGRRIRISGTPKKHGKFWVLESPSDIFFDV